MSWRLAGSLKSLRREVDNAFPGRSKRSDGTIGDRAHRNRRSDHNPDRYGIVRALDLTADVVNGINVATHVAELARRLGKERKAPVKYIIYRGRIASHRQNWAWRRYYGSNPHNTHVHISVSGGSWGDRAVRWGAAPVKLRRHILSAVKKKEDIMATKDELREIVREEVSRAVQEIRNFADRGAMLRLLRVANDEETGIVGAVYQWTGSEMHWLDDNEAYNRLVADGWSTTDVEASLIDGLARAAGQKESPRHLAADVLNPNWDDEEES